MPTSLYRFYDAQDGLLYVGITNSIPRRLEQHDEQKPWFAEAARVTLEHHPDRVTALAAEKAAIKAERPKYNIVHNHGRRVFETKSAADSQWVFRSRESGIERQTDLRLYPELDGSAVVDDFHYLDGEGQFEEYLQYIQRSHIDWFVANAVPIVWSVLGSGICESAPFLQTEAPLAGDFLTYFTWPEGVQSEERLDWYQLPVVNDRFPEFAKALAWTPSPMQPYFPIASVLRSRGYYVPWESP